MLGGIDVSPYKSMPQQAILFMVLSAQTWLPLLLTSRMLDLNVDGILNINSGCKVQHLKSLFRFITQVNYNPAETV